jgi:DNA end-binding protein Ku
MAEQRRDRLPAKLTGRSAPKTAEAGHDIWNGTISFSLVAIPVRLVEAIAPGRVSFRMLHRKDYSPLVSRMLCPREGKIVPREEIVRGYEIKPGRYIQVTDRELDSVSPERSRTIEVTHFVDAGEVDPVYFDYQYYLVPLKGGEKPYRLLVEVLRRTEKAGVASLVLADREYPVLVRSAGGLLAVNTLHYPDEIVAAKELGRKRGQSLGARGRAVQSPFSPGDGEKERMKRVIGRMVSKFDPEKYADQRRERIVALLKKKMKGKSLVQAPQTEETEGESPVDLVAALKASMRKTRKRG